MCVFICAEAVCLCVFVAEGAWGVRLCVCAKMGVCDCVKLFM